MAKSRKAADSVELPRETDPKKLDVKAYAVRLLAHVRRRVRAYVWRYGPGILAKGSLVEDVVQEAILSLFTKWDSAKYPDPWPYLLLEVRTKFSNLASSYDAQNVGALKDDHVETTRERHLLVGLKLGDPEFTPEDAILAKENQRWRERVHEAFLEELVDDEQLMALHDLAENEDIEEPRFVAGRLGLSISEVNNQKKKLKRVSDRVLRKVRDEYVKAEKTR